MSIACEMALTSKVRSEDYLWESPEMNKHMLSFELDRSAGKLEIHADDAGLEFLIQQLSLLRRAVGQDHVHLMTEDWGGSGLSNQKQNEASDLLNHVKIFKW